MKPVAAIMLVALCAIGCGGGGSSSGSSIGNTQPQGQSNTYVGSFYNSQGQALGTATVTVVGSWLQATCVPSSGTGTTFLITGNLTNGTLISTGTPPTQIGTGSISGTTLSITGFTDSFDLGYGPVNVTATQTS